MPPSERMITLAGEGIELPIATDHNVQIDHEPFARADGRAAILHAGDRQRGDDAVGPLQRFPVAAGAAAPIHNSVRVERSSTASTRTPGVKVAILNHARDLHSGVRPFGPALFNAVVGENLDGWAMRFNAMEVLNSAPRKRHLAAVPRLDGPA
jgi:hypothetical protein